MRGKKLLPIVGKKTSIFDAFKHGSSSLQSLDPFADICPLIESLQLPENLSLSTLFPEESEDDFNSEWEPDGDSDDCSEPESDDDGNVFDAFNDHL